MRSLHAQATQKAANLGHCLLAKSSSFACYLHLYKGRSKGRKAQRSVATQAKHGPDRGYRQSNREPWVLATNLSPELFESNRIVKFYRQRMQIEGSFRDLKSSTYGLALQVSRSRTPKRFDILLLIALIVHLCEWWAGFLAQRKQWTKQFQANTTRRRRVLSIVRLGRDIIKRMKFELTRKDWLKGAEIFRQQAKRYGDLMSYL